MVTTNLIDCAEAGRLLGISPHGVRYLIRQGTLPARQLAGVYLIERAALKKMHRRGRGRPKKESA
jgi:hypothetical protein